MTAPSNVPRIPACALCSGKNGGHDMDCPALSADAAAKPLTLEDAIARAHPAEDPIVKLREIAQQLTYFQSRRGYGLARWLDNWLDRYTK